MAYEKLRLLLSVSQDHFIGYGNPDSDILILGKEEARKSDDEISNFNQWKTIVTAKDFTPKNIDIGIDYNFSNEYFSPKYPFFLQKNHIQKKCDDKRIPIWNPRWQGVGTSSTWYYYQRLICKIFEYQTEDIDFFKYCFISELNDTPMKNHKENKEIPEPDIKKKIAERLDWMQSPGVKEFWNSFKVVILACGPYKEKIISNPILLKNLFGNAKIFWSNQLSQWDKKIEIDIPEIKRALAQ